MFLIFLIFVIQVKTMRASCVICTENFTLDSEISASPCGHTFHDECLGRWIRQGSKTCPQCRKQVNIRLLSLNYAIKVDIAIPVVYYI